MGKAWAGVVAVVAVAWLAVGSSGPGSSAEGLRRARMAGEWRGLELRAGVVQAGGVIAVETRLVNERDRAAYLVPDQCGRLTEVALARTRPEPEGQAWDGSIAAVKRLVVEAQRRLQEPERLSPRRPGEASSAVPDCRRPERVVALPPGSVVRERWETDAMPGMALDTVGADGLEIRAEVVEARRAGDVEYLDIGPAGAADRVRAGRRLRLTLPAGAVIDHEPGRPATGPSNAELFDRLLEDGRLRSWIAAQPAASWRSGRLLGVEDRVEFSAVTTRYERAVRVDADADGGDIRVRLPGAEDRTRRFQTRPATLPFGIELRRHSRDWLPTREVVAGRLALPSGQIVLDGYPNDRSPVLRLRVPPGAYPAFVTLARSQRGHAGSERVALATLAVSRRRPVRWRRIGGVGVDGGVAAFTSREGADILGGAALSDPDSEYFERSFDSLTAHDHTVTELPVGDGLNQILFSTGAGDGGYPLLAGFDSEDRPVRFVADFLLMHLRWPGRPG
jgi:hypothetical protein